MAGMNRGLGRGLSELLNASQQASVAQGRDGNFGQDLIKRSLAAKYGTNPEDESFELPPDPSVRLQEIKAHIGDVEQELTDSMAGAHAKFMILDSAQGRLTISFHSLAELEAILQRFGIKI